MPRGTETGPSRPSGRRDPTRPRSAHSGRPRAPTQDAQALANLVVVLDEPQDVVNVAAVIRGMMNMGLSRLRLVRPHNFDPYRVEGIAHRSAQVVGTAALHDSLESAVADAVFVVGTSARPRTANRNYAHPSDAAPALIERARSGTVCVLFGREDRGLTNQALDLCHTILTIPTDPGYWSLNLAQAFLLVAYELFLTAGGGAGELPRGRRATAPATRPIWRACTRPSRTGSAGSSSSKAPGGRRRCSAPYGPCSAGPISTPGRPGSSGRSASRSAITWIGPWAGRRTTDVVIPAHPFMAEPGGAGLS